MVGGVDLGEWLVQRGLHDLGRCRAMKTVWIYINTDAPPGDVDHLQVFW
jgi:hypothetical protein